MTSTVRGDILAALRDMLGPASVLSEERDLALYAYDATVETHLPDVAVLPESAEQVAAVVRFAYERGIPVVPRGGGTSLSGGPVPVEGGIVVALTKMDRILELDVPNLRAVVQPGVINMDLLEAAEKQGFLYAPDPSSQIACTMGGNVGENSGGPHCLKYGVTTNHITGLEMVLPDGRLLRTGRKVVDWPGYDLTGAIVGSEGTFGIVTEITCRLIAKPEAIVTMLAIYDSLDDASRTVSGIIAAGLLPATLEMMDRPMIEAVQKGFDAGYPEDAEVVLIIEVDGLQAGMDRQLERIRQVCEQHNVRKFEWADDAAERVRLWRGRKGAFGAVANISANKLSTDVTVPRTELPTVLAEVMEIGRRHGVPVANVFHAGDGNLHPQVLYDARDADQVERVKRIDKEIVELAVAHGGVLTGEHGIGSCKRKWMPTMFGPSDLRAMWALKDVFDPGGTMNPAKVLPDRDTLGVPKPWPLPHSEFATSASKLAPQDDDGTLYPYDVEAVGKLMALAARDGQPLSIRGGGTKISSGRADGQPADESKAATVCTLGLHKILLRDPENMTIKAEAGCRWQDLQDAAAEVGQFVPLRPACPAEATIGGVIATNASGPHRLRYGTCRDLLTGLRFVLPGGEVVNMGSRCVKNVSGYALEKLLIGSHGSLGVIVDATFRTFPLPETRRTLCYGAPAPSLTSTGPLADFVSRALAGHLLPAALEALTPALASLAARQSGVALAAPEGQWLVAVALEGLREEVAYMAEAFDALAVEHGLTPVGTVESAGYDAFWEAITRPGNHIVQATCLISQILTLSACILEILGASVPLRAGLGTGVIVLAPDTAATDPSLELDRMARRHGGWAYWLPPRPEGSGFPEPAHAVAADLCRRIKSTYDPRNILPSLFPL